MGIAETFDTTPAATRETLLVEARALVPILAARSNDCERLRRCPDETVRDYVDRGLLRVCQPRRYGGYELGYDVLCEIIETLAEQSYALPIATLLVFRV